MILFFALAGVVALGITVLLASLPVMLVVALVKMCRRGRTTSRSRAGGTGPTAADGDWDVFTALVADSWTAAERAALTEATTAT